MAAYCTYQLATGNEITAGGLAGAALIGGVMGLFGGLTGIALITEFTAAAAGEALWVAFATGVFGAGVAGLGGALDKGVEDATHPRMSPAERAVGSIMGYQFLLACILSED
jgi:hypothetical protein